MTSIELFTGFAVNLIVALIIVRGIYYPAKQDKNYVSAAARVSPCDQPHVSRVHEVRTEKRLRRLWAGVFGVVIEKDIKRNG